MRIKPTGHFDIFILPQMLDNQRKKIYNITVYIAEIYLGVDIYGKNGIERDPRKISELF